MKPLTMNLLVPKDQANMQDNIFKMKIIIMYKLEAIILTNLTKEIEAYNNW